MSVLNALVLVWLAITCAGLAYCVRLVRRAKDAKRWLKANGMNGYRDIVASGAIHRGFWRMWISVAMVAMGVCAGALQFYAVGSDARIVLSGVFRLLFIFMAAAFTYKSYLEDHELDLLMSESQRRALKSSRVGDGENAAHEQ